MKKSIKVKEKELISKLNANVANHEQEQEFWGKHGPIKFGDEEDTQDDIHWDNHGPIQFEEENKPLRDSRGRFVKKGPCEYEGDGTETIIVKESGPDCEDVHDADEPSIIKGEETWGRDCVPTSDYESVNHPQHYNNYDVEVIDMMERIFGTEAVISFCKLNAFKYRMRAGTKPTSTADEDLRKEQWYLSKMRELSDTDENDSY